MKKLTILLTAILAISFSSCKKDWICTCSYDDGNVHKIIGVPKKTAEANCISKTENGQTETCELTPVN